jgi:hypothetical protein
VYIKRVNYGTVPVFAEGDNVDFLVLGTLAEDKRELLLSVDCLSICIPKPYRANYNLKFTQLFEVGGWVGGWFKNVKTNWNTLRKIIRNE